MLKGVTGGYNRLQGVIVGITAYRGLQEVTKGDRGLLEVKGG